MTREWSLILTVGHSTRSIGELTGLLEANGATMLVDVRKMPRSRRHPHFNSDQLARTLPSQGILYHHMPELGGLRKPRHDSINTAWRNDSFRGYADYMQTPEFERAVQKLVGISAGGQPVIMCAEAVPWRCHRSLIADALTARRFRVEHIIGPGERRPHQLTPFASVDGNRVTYPGAQLTLRG